MSNMFFRILALLVFYSFACGYSAWAQSAMPDLNLNAGKEGEIATSPLCSALINRSDQTILGTLSTATQTIETGETVKHQNNFRLAAGEKMEFCSTGPFYEGRRLAIVLRTLIPLFECKTMIDEPVYLDAVEQPGGFRKLSATCK